MTPMCLIIFFLSASRKSDDVLPINTMFTSVYEIWVMLPVRWKAETVRFSRLLHHFIHQLPFIKSFIFHTHLYFCFILLCHCPQRVSASKFHLSAPSRRGDRADEARGRHIKRWMLALVLPPPSPSPPLFEFAGPSICLRMIWSWLSQEGKKGPPPMTNDNLRINTPEREGMRNRAESLFHHPSVSVGLLINLWSLPMTLFWCLSLIFSHSLTLVIISGNLSFCS